MTAAIDYVSLGMITVSKDSNGNSKYVLHWDKMIYYLIALMTMASLAGWLFERGQIVAVILTILLLLIVYVFYALRWFTKQKDVSTNSNASCPGAKDTTATSSIPIVNMCPDFMVVWTDSTNGNVYCYDDKNTYNMRTYKGAGLTTGLNINNVSGQSAFLMKNNSQNTSAVDLKSDTGGMRWPFLYMLMNHIDTMTNDQYGAFLRWEGVWDGLVLTANSAPLP